MKLILTVDMGVRGVKHLEGLGARESTIEFSVHVGVVLCTNRIDLKTKCRAEASLIFCKTAEG